MCGLTGAGATADSHPHPASLVACLINIRDVRWRMQSGRGTGRDKKW